MSPVESPTVGGAKLLTVKEAEQYCNLPPKAGYELINEGEWPFAMRLSKARIRIDRADLDAWLDGKKQGQGKAA